MSRKNGLGSIARGAGAPTRRSAVGDVIQSELFRLQGEVKRDTSLDEIIEGLLPALYEGVRRGTLVSLSSASNSGVVRLRIFDGGDAWEWYAADPEWATVLGEAIAEVFRKIDA